MKSNMGGSPMAETKWVRTDDHRWQLVTRRKLLKAAAAGAAAVGLGSVFPLPQIVRAQMRRLTFLHWSHFVPGFDKWFEGEYTKEWGKAHAVAIVVAHVQTCQIEHLHAAEGSARTGHDL